MEGWAGGRVVAARGDPPTPELALELERLPEWINLYCRCHERLSYSPICTGEAGEPPL